MRKLTRQRPDSIKNRTIKWQNVMWTKWGFCARCFWFNFIIYGIEQIGIQKIGYTLNKSRGKQISRYNLKQRIWIGLSLKI